MNAMTHTAQLSSSQQAMTIRELLTYLKSIPEDTVFPVGLGKPFIISNITDQIVFSPVLFAKAGNMSNSLDYLLGAELTSRTGARGIIQLDRCYAYFGLDDNSGSTPLNLLVLTMLRAMSTDTIKIKAKFVKEDTSEMSKASVEFAVPKIWWQTLSLKHRNALALEYMTNQLFSGITYLPTGTKVELEEKKEDKKQETAKQDSPSETVQPPVATIDPKANSSTTQTEKAQENGSESRQEPSEKKEESTQSEQTGKQDSGTQAEDGGKQNVDKQDTNVSP
nr:MAG TPA: hypothetical protein [Caudoviricetes sp.]